MSAAAQLFYRLSDPKKGTGRTRCTIDGAMMALETVANDRITSGSPNSWFWSKEIVEKFCDDVCTFSRTGVPQTCDICHTERETGCVFEVTHGHRFFAGTSCMTRVIANMYLRNYGTAMAASFADRDAPKFDLRAWLSLWDCLMELTSVSGYRLSPDVRMKMIEKYIPMYQVLTVGIFADDESTEPEYPPMLLDSDDDESTEPEPAPKPAPKRQRVLGSEDDESTEPEPAPKRQRVPIQTVAVDSNRPLYINMLACMMSHGTPREKVYETISEFIKRGPILDTAAWHRAVIMETMAHMVTTGTCKKTVDEIISVYIPRN